MLGAIIIIMFLQLKTSKHLHIILLTCFDKTNEHRD